jgi:hypothetical protein
MNTGWSDIPKKERNDNQLENHQLAQKNVTQRNFLLAQRAQHKN